jgi:propanol-preferring alcohol dehydrogenase
MKKTMKAMLLPRCVALDKTDTPLEEAELPVPEPHGDEILVRVSACGVCRTELDEIEGRTAPSFYPIVPGHQATGTVCGLGDKADRFAIGARVGVGWIHSACGACDYCLSGRENLCARFQATGRDAHGGYAEYLLAREAFAVGLPDALPDTSVAPLLCAGAVGYRALRAAGIKDGEALGFAGFGASAHLVLQAARFLYPRVAAYVFTRSPQQREFARVLGASWAGGLNDDPPRPLDAVIDTTPVWEPLVRLAPSLKPGGRFVINAIRKERLDNDLLSTLVYERHLWMEREIKSVANVTRRDIAEFLGLAARIPLQPEITVYPLVRANQALLELKKGDQKGAKVLVM